MKTLNSICMATLETLQGDVKIVLCDFVMSPSGPHKLDDPIMSCDYSCGFCGGRLHYTPFLDPCNRDHASRIWLCANHLCEVYTKQKTFSNTSTQLTLKRSLEWPAFCELNDIGDEFYNVKFEKIEQATGKIDYLLKFANKPYGLIYMQGEPGSGKTYACMGTCELFTRRSQSAFFCTQHKMYTDWIDSFKSDKTGNYIGKLKNVELLVIDDFGTGEISEKFMTFFMDLINTRLQWSNRGTIITTNLDNEEFSKVCGKALNDRIGTGQKMKFEEKSRREKITL